MYRGRAATGGWSGPGVSPRSSELFVRRLSQQLLDITAEFRATLNLKMACWPVTLEISSDDCDFRKKNDVLKNKGPLIVANSSGRPHFGLWHAFVHSDLDPLNRLWAKFCWM